ncbi:hypothetical protein SCP_0313310 [Sparassis crispa]|uniref:Uncharacterized protein n=1 Tax=Sparassis crispa TaxID=139825 RepID=A0A401GHG3_9APHY|nr:hypothetical protein SCP_0313310 [Sparassis crispa]GBE81602.1 hypothetical protein SCP_0313310 [Sparassis crispa]
MTPLHLRDHSEKMAITIADLAALPTERHGAACIINASNRNQVERDRGGVQDSLATKSCRFAAFSGCSIVSWKVCRVT